MATAILLQECPLFQVRVIPGLRIGSKHGQSIASVFLTLRLPLLTFLRLRRRETIYSQCTLSWLSTCLNSLSPVTNSALFALAKAAAKQSASDILYLDLKAAA